MHRHRVGTVSAATISAVLALAGCSHREAPTLPAEPPTSSVTTSTAVPHGAVPPAPDALADVLYRLADPAVPGVEKVGLIEGATPVDSGNVDRFAAALRDGAYLPLTFDVADVGWSDRNPGNATANVNVTTRNPDAGEFAFPMEFTPRGDGWQLAQQTAELLLAFGTSRAGATPSVTPTP